MTNQMTFEHMGIATAEEIIFDLGKRNRVKFRHFIHELYAPNARKGVQHRRHTLSKLRIIDGRPCVKYQGELREITANLCVARDRRDGRNLDYPMVYDVRLFGLSFANA